MYLVAFNFKVEHYLGKTNPIDRLLRKVDYK
jgi:hypothetical protein